MYFILINLLNFAKCTKKIIIIYLKIKKYSILKDNEKRLPFNISFSFN